MTIWTPGGEHEVPREGEGADQGRSTPSSPSGGEGSHLPRVEDLGDDPETRAAAEAMARELAEARQRLVEVPAAIVVANHAMGLYELAAIHLSSQPPNLAEAKVAIDAFGAVLGSVEGMLGEDEVTLTDALAQIRLAFVQLQASVGGGATPSAEPSDTTPPSPTPAAPDAPVDDPAEPEGLQADGG